MRLRLTLDERLKRGGRGVPYEVLRGRLAVGFLAPDQQVAPDARSHAV